LFEFWVAVQLEQTALLPNFGRYRWSQNGKDFRQRMSQGSHLFGNRIKEFGDAKDKDVDSFSGGGVV
jgi:hypothetical protein